MTPSELARYGRDKAKRSDLRTVGLALTVTPDYSIPVLSEIYPGNRNDTKQFAVMLEQLQQRFRRTAGREADITIVFDRGNNSGDNLDLLESEGLQFHYVGGLRKDQLPELFAVRKSEYSPLECPGDADEKYRGLSSYRTEAEVFGRKVTAVIVHNPELESGQPRIICINLSLDGPSDRRPCLSLRACLQALRPSPEGTPSEGDRLQHQPVPGVNERRQQGHNFLWGCRETQED